jgi:hypothetical protein
MWWVSQAERVFSALAMADTSKCEWPLIRARGYMFSALLSYLLIPYPMTRRFESLLGKQ